MDIRYSKSGNMTRSGKNGLNIRTNRSPIWDRTRCPEEQVFSIGVSHPLQMFYGNLPKLGKKVKVSKRSSLLRKSQSGVMSDKLKVSLYMVMSENVM